MKRKEDEHLEFKEAKGGFHFEKLVKYCAALANEGGGVIVLGVTDTPPRIVVGTRAFSDLERTKAGLVDRLRLRIEAEQILHDDGRVLLFKVPPRPAGMPVHHMGTYWMRGGDSLVPMTQDMLKRVFEETGPDFSAGICNGASFSDLDPLAIERFRELWQKKSGGQSLSKLSDEQLLEDAELIVDGAVTYAALILFGSKRPLGKYLAQAEVIFEYRSSEASVPFQQRVEWREGFFLYFEDLWTTISLRNEVQQFRDGLFVWDIPTFNESVVREVILNAIGHRDYRLGGSIFVRQYPRRLELVSPGGFPPGITPENILWRQNPRNRRIAEAFARCGLVERSGQGANCMFEECVKESKPRPDFTGTDDYQVSVSLLGEVQDPRFLKFIELVGNEKQISFSTENLIVLDLVHREQKIPAELKVFLNDLKNCGIVETVSRGRGTRYILSRRLYGFIGKKGEYTRRRGLDREMSKELVLKHIRDNKAEGSRLQELMQVLRGYSRYQVQALLRELKAAGLIHCVGRTSSAKWYPLQARNRSDDPGTQ